MRQLLVSSLLLAATIFFSSLLLGQSSFDITVRLDPNKGFLNGEEMVALTNTSNEVWEFLFFQWGLSASTKRVEEAIDGGGNPLFVRYIKPEDELLKGKGFLFEVTLHSPLLPGEETILKLKFVAENLTQQGDTLLLSDNWYPILYASAKGKNSGASNESALYKVSLALPSSFKVAASGKEVSRHQDEEGWLQIDYEGEFLRGFSLMLSSGWKRLVTYAGEVEIQSYFQPKDEHWGKRLPAIASEVIAFYSRKFGFYPYEKLCIVPGSATEEGGYATPNIIVVHQSLDRMASDFGVSFALGFSRWVVAHLIASQYWGIYIVDAPPFPPWLPNGLALYSDRSYMESIRLSNPIYYNLLQYYLQAAAGGLNTTVLRPIAELDEELPNWENILAKGKALAIINMLVHFIGEEEFDRVLIQLLRHYHGKEVTAEDFQRVVEQVTQQDLGWFFEQWLKTNKFLDYQVGQIKTTHVGNRYVTTIEVNSRRGGALMPILVKISLEDGEEVFEELKGRQRRERVKITTTSPPQRVELDPEGILPDINRANNYEVLREIATVEELFKIDQFFQIGELFLSRNFQPRERYLQDRFKLRVKNVSNSERGLGIVILAEFANVRSKGRRSFYLSLAPYEERVIEDYYLLPRGSGKAKIQVSYYMVKDEKEFKRIGRRQLSDLSNNYIVIVPPNSGR